MNDETVSPDAETQIQAPVVEETPEVTTPEVEAEAEVTSQDQTESEADKALKRMQRRIDKRTADVYRERARAEQLAQEVASLKAQSGQQDQPREQDDPKVLAREIARIERFNDQANAIVSEGTKANPDYMLAMRELAREVGDFVKPNGAPSQFMEVVLEVVDKPAAVMYHLGKNPDLAEELADLSPLKLAKRLDRIERELNDKSNPKPGSAPKPLEPIKPEASDSGLNPDLSTEEWMRRREKQLREKRGY